MSRRLERTPTADDALDWLRYPQLWELKKSAMLEARVSREAEKAVGRILSRNYAKLYFREKLNKDVKDPQVTIDQTEVVEKLALRMMTDIERRSEFFAERPDSNMESLISLFNSPPGINISGEEFYKLQISGVWSEDANANFKAGKMIPPHIIAYRLAVLKALGLKLNPNNQILGNPVPLGSLEQRSVMILNGVRVMTDVMEYAVPGNTNVSIRIYKPQSALGEKGISEMICVR